MGLNKAKGNMYEFITHTWNPIKGKCPHVRFDEKELKYGK